MHRYRQLEEAASFWKRQTAGSAGWKLEDAKARFSEVVRRARSEGPQRVTVRGKEAVVIISSEEYERMQPAEEPVPLVDYLESLYVEGLDLTREPDRGRDIDL
jgi:antitoxin Phd